MMYRDEEGRLIVVRKVNFGRDIEEIATEYDYEIGVGIQYFEFGGDRVYPHWGIAINDERMVEWNDLKGRGAPLPNVEKYYFGIGTMLPLAVFYGNILSYHDLMLKYGQDAFFIVWNKFNILGNASKYCQEYVQWVKGNGRYAK